MVIFSYSNYALTRDSISQDNFKQVAEIGINVSCLCRSVVEEKFQWKNRCWPILLNRAKNKMLLLIRIDLPVNSLLCHILPALQPFIRVCPRQLSRYTSFQSNVKLLLSKYAWTSGPVGHVLAVPILVSVNVTETVRVGVVLFLEPERLVRFYWQAWKGIKKTIYWETMM